MLEVWFLEVFDKKIKFLAAAEEFQGHVEKGMGAGSYTGDVPRSDAGTLSNYILRDSAFRSEDKTVNSFFDRLDFDLLIILAIKSILLLVFTEQQKQFQRLL